MKTESERRGERNCAQCVYMYEERVLGNPLQRLMVCHRMPPTAIAMAADHGSLSLFSAFPIVTAQNFCHEFSRDPSRDAVNDPVNASIKGRESAAN